MRWDSRPAGGWLLGTGIGLGGSHLIPTVSVGGRHPVWPYFLFGAIAGVGLVLYLAGGRGERTGAPGGDRAKRLAFLGAHLRALATGRGLTVEDVRTRVTGTWSADDAEQYMAGASWPDWPFVQAFAKLVADSKWHRVDIERELRPLWMTAAPAVPRKISRAAGRATAVVAAVAILAAVGTIVAVVQPPQRERAAAAAPPICNPPPPGLGSQQIYCDDFRSDANEAPSLFLVIELRGCAESRFGGPNDEALHGHPLHGRGLAAYRAHEVVNSVWIEEAIKVNSVHLHHSDAPFRQLHHYALLFHDERLEALARGIESRGWKE
jgi:hypothetical protein